MKIDFLQIQGDFVVAVQGIPHRLSNSSRVRRQADVRWLSPKGGQGGAVPFIGVDEAPLPGQGRIVKKQPVTGAALIVCRLQNGQGEVGPWESRMMPEIRGV